MTALAALESQIDLFRYHKAELIAEHARRRGGTHIPQTVLETLHNAAVLLEQAESIWVADWVVDTLEDAVNTFPEDYRITPADMPMFHGFAELQRPVTLFTRPNRAGGVIISAVAWYYDETRAQVLIGIFGKTLDNEERGWKHLTECKGITIMPVGRLLEYDHTHNPSGRYVTATGDGRYIVEEGDPEILRALWEAESLFVHRFVVSLWLFMRERRVVDITTVGASRPLRRRMEAEQLPMPTRVQTIVLRASDRPVFPGCGNAEPSREYNVRWIVRGHWHRYWVKDEDDPAVKRLRPRWVSAYVKGPEGAELNHPHRLFAVTK